MVSVSNVEIRCPRCGAPSALINKVTSEYGCTHCNSTFRFLDPNQKTVLKGKIVHNCQSCGAPVKDEAGFVCTKCGKEWLCQNCVKKFEQRYVCSDCLKKNYVVSGTDKVCPQCNHPLQYDKEKNQWQCYYPCFKYVTHVCPECGMALKYIPQYREFYCYNCKMYPSEKAKGLIASQSGYRCSRCGNSLTFVPQYQRWYCYNCGMYA